MVLQGALALCTWFCFRMSYPVEVNVSSFPCAGHLTCSVAEQANQTEGGELFSIVAEILK